MEDKKMTIDKPEAAKIKDHVKKKETVLKEKGNTLLRIGKSILLKQMKE